MSTVIFKEIRRSKAFKLNVLMLIISTLTVFGIILSKNYTAPDGLAVSFINVGQGDSALITADGYSVLIDGGPDSNAENIRTVLDRYSIKKLDLVIASHPDADHISGLPRVISGYDVKRFAAAEISPDIADKTLDLSELNNALERKGLKAESLRAGDKITLGKFTLDILSPGREYGNTNDDSVVAMLSYKDKRILFTGDISSKVEKALLKSRGSLKADVLKVSHHGSKTATGKSFLKAVSPDAAIVSVSAYNSYNLPSLRTMQTLRSQGCKIYRTDENGNITVHFSNGAIEYTTEK